MPQKLTMDTEHSHLVHAFGIVYEAPTFTQWDQAILCRSKFSLLQHNQSANTAHPQPVGPGLLAYSCSLALSARHLVHALGIVYETPTFTQWDPAILCRSRFSLLQHKQSDGRDYDLVPTQPTFSQWDPAFSLTHALWHCLRGISYMPLALSARRPRSPSGTRPFCVAAGFLCCSTNKVTAETTI